MGYDAHITCGDDWSRPAVLIEAGQWRRLVGSRPELAEWLEFEAGVVSAKNPSRAQLAEMIAIAEQLGATVQGDDGERYPTPDRPTAPLRPGLLARVIGFLAGLRRPSPLPPQTPPFPVGTRVRSPLRGLGTVVACDPAASHGLGALTVEFDDGDHGVFSCAAHGLDGVAEP